MSAATTVPWDRLIEPDRVHGSLYTDPAVWEAELERIWYRTWVYVGHESEVPEPNDYVLKSIGPQPVIMTRDRAGGIHLLLNRCSHRANLVCDAARGNSSAFRCPYHGWTFANTGALLGYPFSSGYGGRELKAELGLARVPRMESYRGFVFGSFAEDGPSLAEHLGDAAGEIDRLVRLSPEGRVQLTAGWLQHKVRANWKMLLENETDGYHPQFVHASIFAVADSGIGELYGEKSAAVSRDLGGGHTENDLRPPPPRLRGGHAGGLRRCRRADPRRRLAPRDDLPQPVHRRDPDLRAATGGGRRDRPARDGHPVRRCPRAQPPDAPADAGLGRPGGIPAGRRLGDVRAQPAGRAGPPPGMAGAQAGPAPGTPRRARPPGGR